ncbi:MAG TPA: AarF/ABC1/UbiB kinase family protein [Blastocatellia bacterium]
MKTTDMDGTIFSDGPETESTPLRQLEELVWDLSTRPVPTGRLTRFVPAVVTPIRVAFTYLEAWASTFFKGGSAREERIRQARIKAGFQMLATMAHLRGIFIKLGQALANYPDLVPDEVAETFWALNFQSPPMHFSLVREMVKNELGGEPEDLFESFEPRAFAAASLGQVHRARLKTGEEVAVKIQYPNIGATIRQDLANLATLFAPLRLGANWEHLAKTIEDMKKTLSAETDYDIEAGQLSAARALFAGDDSFFVPRVFPDLSTHRILVMDYVPGIHLDRFLASNPSQQDRDSYGTLLLRSSLRLYYQARLIYSDINPGNYIFMPGGKLGLIDFGSCRAFTDKEWELSEELGRAGRIGGEDWRAVLRRCATGSPTGNVSDGYLAVIEEAANWFREPVRLGGTFDFSDDGHLRRGLDILKRAQSFKDPRTDPVNLWLWRLFLSVRALLHRLGARVEYRAAMELEGASPMYD